MDQYDSDFQKTKPTKSRNQSLGDEIKGETRDRRQTTGGGWRRNGRDLNQPLTKQSSRKIGTVSRYAVVGIRAAPAGVLDSVSRRKRARDSLVRLCTKVLSSVSPPVSLSWK